MFIEILFKILLFKGGVLIYAEHCMYIYSIYIYIYIYIYIFIFTGNCLYFFCHFSFYFHYTVKYLLFYRYFIYFKVPQLN